MTFGIYAIRDCKAGFLAPTLDQSDEQSIRNFEHGILTTDSLFITHAKDFSLWRIGTYETDTGLITPHVPAIHLVDADALVKKGGDDGIIK